MNTDPIIGGLEDQPQSSTLTLVSLPHQYSVTVDRNTILSMFPQSLIGTTLELDPAVDQIDIPNPDVTPVALDAIEVLIRTRALPLTYRNINSIAPDLGTWLRTMNTIKYVQPNPDFAKAAHYLGIDPLVLLSESELGLATFNRHYPVRDWLNYNELSDPSVYRGVILALQNGFNQIVWYLLHVTDPVKTREIDQELVTVAVNRQRPDILELLRRRGTDFSANDNEAIRTAVTYPNVDLVNLLLSDPRVDPSVDSNLPLKLAVDYGNLDVVKRLLQDPRVDPTTNNSEVIDIALLHNRTNIVDFLMQNESIRAKYQQKEFGVGGLPAVIPGPENRYLREEWVDPFELMKNLPPLPTVRSQ